MREVIYKGNATNFGRHGKIKPEDRLHLLEDEWQNLKGDDRFEAVKKIKEPDSPRTLPKKTPHYDLRSIKWNSGRLSRQLRKFKKSKLIRIIEAMNFMGCKIEVPKQREQLDILVDTVHHNAVINGWANMKTEDILTSGVQKKPAKKIASKSNIRTRKRKKP